MRRRIIKGVCIFGGHVGGYPRSEVIRKGLERGGIRVSFCRASPKRKVFSRYAVLMLKYLSMRRDFSVIYVPEFRHKDVPLAWLLGRLSRKLVVFDPLVSRFDTKIRDRGDARDGSFQAWHNRNLDRISLRLPDLVLADTRAHAEYYVSEFGADNLRVRVLPLGFDDEVFYPRPIPCGNRGKSGTHKVLFFGSYLPLHGVGTIIEAAKILKEDRRIRFELIGGGQVYPLIERAIAREKLLNVTLLPRIPLGELPRAISEASICLGIFGETEKASRVIPNKIYQCLAMGKPIITADTRAMRERFSDGEVICLVPAGDPRALADSITYLVSHPELREGMGRKARALVEENYTSGAIAKRFLDCCEEAMTAKIPFSG